MWSVDWTSVSKGNSSLAGLVEMFISVSMYSVCFMGLVWVCCGALQRVEMH